MNDGSDRYFHMQNELMNAQFELNTSRTTLQKMTTEHEQMATLLDQLKQAKEQVRRHEDQQTKASTRELAMQLKLQELEEQVVNFACDHNHEKTHPNEWR